MPSASSIPGRYSSFLSGLPARAQLLMTEAQDLDLSDPQDGPDVESPNALMEEGFEISKVLSVWAVWRARERQSEIELEMGGGGAKASASGNHANLSDDGDSMRRTATSHCSHRIATSCRY